MNTEGLMQINTVAKELGIGEYHLFKYLREKKIFFYDNNCECYNIIKLMKEKVLGNITI